MTIQLNDDYFIEADRYSYVLKQNTGKKDKDNNDIINVLGYYGSVDKAVKKYIEIAIINEHEELTLKEFLQEYKTLVERVEKIK